MQISFASQRVLHTYAVYQTLEKYVTHRYSPICKVTSRVQACVVSSVYDLSDRLFPFPTLPHERAPLAERVPFIFNLDRNFFKLSYSAEVREVSHPVLLTHQVQVDLGIGLCS